MKNVRRYIPLAVLVTTFISLFGGITSDTLVRTSRKKYKTIKLISSSDKILTFVGNIDNPKLKKSKTEAIIKYEAKQLISIETLSGIIRVGEEKKFYDYYSEKWIAAKDLSEDNFLTCWDPECGEFYGIAVLSLTKVKLDSPVFLYSFILKEDHSYFVIDSSGNSILVHNGFWSTLLKLLDGKKIKRTVDIFGNVIKEPKVMSIGFELVKHADLKTAIELTFGAIATGSIIGMGVCEGGKWLLGSKKSKYRKHKHTPPTTGVERREGYKQAPIYDDEGNYNCDYNPRYEAEAIAEEFNISLGIARSIERDAAKLATEEAAKKRNSRATDPTGRVYDANFIQRIIREAEEIKKKAEKNSPIITNVTTPPPPKPPKPPKRDDDKEEKEEKITNIPNQKPAPKINYRKNSLDHIFNNKKNHLPKTRRNVKLLRDLANNKQNYQGTDANGNHWYAKTNSNGTQNFVRVHGDKIVGGGVNEAPRMFDPIRGLCNPPK